MIGKVRPQILLSIVVLGILADYGVQSGMGEIPSGCIAGITALGMKVLEGSGPE